MKPFFPKLQQATCPRCKHVNTGHAPDAQAASVISACANCDCLFTMDTAYSAPRQLTEQELEAAPVVHLQMIARVTHLNRVHRCADIPSEALASMPEKLAVRLMQRNGMIESPPHLAWSLVNAFRHNDAVRN